MKNVKPTPYVPAELEIIELGVKDIVTTSGNGSDDDQYGYVSDSNVDNGW